MTAQYLPLIKQHLETKYPQTQNQSTLKIENIRFKLFLAPTSLLLGQYEQLKQLSITHCDLRNLQNFPHLYELEELDLGFNKLQGTFNNLMPLKKLKYLNIQSNIVFDFMKLAPLRKITGATTSSQEKNQLKIHICIKNNPFTNQQAPYQAKFKSYGLKVIKQPKQYFEKKKQDEDKNTKQITCKKQFNKKSLTKKGQISLKKPWYQLDQLDESDSNLSSIVGLEDTKKNVSIQSGRNDERRDQQDQRHQNSRMSTIRPNMVQVEENHVPGRLFARISSSSRQGRLQVRDAGENRLFSLEMDHPSDSMNEDDLLRMFEQEAQQDSDSEVNRFPVNNIRRGYSSISRSSSQLFEQRFRNHQTMMRLRELREIERQHRVERQRQRRRELLRERDMNELNRLRSNQQERMRVRMRMRQQEQDRQQERIRTREQEVRSLTEFLRDRLLARQNIDEPQLLRREISRVRHEDHHLSESHNSIQISSSSNNLYRGLMRRPMSYRQFVQRRVGGNAGEIIRNEQSQNSSSNRMVLTNLPQLRVSASLNNNNSNIIRIQRVGSTIVNPINGGQFSNGIPSRQVQRSSFMRNMIIGMDSSQEIEDQVGQQDDQADDNISDSDEDLEEEDDEQMHICDSECERDGRHDIEDDDEEMIDVGADSNHFPDGQAFRFLTEQQNRRNNNRTLQADHPFEFILNDEGVIETRPLNNISNGPSLPLNPPESQSNPLSQQEDSSIPDIL